jgi:hypothetical protein
MATSSFLQVSDINYHRADDLDRYHTHYSYNRFISRFQGKIRLFVYGFLVPIEYQVSRIRFVVFFYGCIGADFPVQYH